MRLFTYMPGEVLEGKPYTTKLCFEVGQLAGQLNIALKVKDLRGMKTVTLIGKTFLVPF